jgi:hypothetical protein
MALVSRSEFAIFGLWEGCHVNYVDLLLKAVAREIGYGLNHVAGMSQSGFDPTSVGQFAAIVRFFAGSRRIGATAVRARRPAFFAIYGFGG